MNFNLDKIPASVLVVVAAVTGGIASVGGLLTFIGADPAQLTDAVNKIGSGILQIISGVSTIVLIVGAVVAKLKDNPLVKLATGALFVKENPQVIAQSPQVQQATVTAATAVIAAAPVETTFTLTKDEKSDFARAAVSMAAHSETAKNTLLDQAVTLPSVNAILTDKATEAATASPLVREGV